jgi:O-antigen/teichoic acid export membrane protein
LGLSRLIISIFIAIYYTFSTIYSIKHISYAISSSYKKIINYNNKCIFLTQAIILIFLIKFKFGVNSFFISQFIVGFIVMYIHIYLMNKEGLIKLFLFKKNTFKKNFKYALGYIPLSFSSWIFGLSDRYIITYYVSIAMAGKYSFIAQLTAIMQVIMQAIDTAYTPIFMKQMKEKTKESLEQIKSYFTVISFLLLFIYLGMVLFLPFLIEKLFPLKYRGDYFLISIFSMGYVFLAFRKMLANILVYYKKSFWISISGYIPAITNLVLNFIFIPKYGMYAAAWTTLISFFLYAIIVFIMAQKLQKFEFDFLKILLFFLIAIFFTFIAYKYSNLIINFILIGLYLLIGQISGIYKLIRR